MKDQESKRGQLKKLPRNSMLDSFYALSCACGSCNCYCSCTQATLRGYNFDTPERSRDVSYAVDFSAMR